MNIFRTTAYYLKKVQESVRRWIAADLINEEIGRRLRAMAAVFPEFAKQLVEAGSAAEAERKLAIAAADKAREALAKAEEKRMLAEEKAAGVKLLSAK